MVDQGRFCFVTVALIPPGPCADAVASLAILDYVGGRAVVQGVWDNERT